MATLLFIRPEEIAKKTILGGNIDHDKYTHIIEMVQISVIERLLGTELYDKIVTDVTNATISGLYLTLYNDFVKPITLYESCAEFIEVSVFNLDNGGLYKHVADNSETATKDERYELSHKYHSISQMYVQRFEKWICNNTLAEYKRYQEEVNAGKIQRTSGWYL